MDIIICRDCKYLRTEYEDEFEFCSCSRHYDSLGFWEEVEDPNHSFCSWGERK